MPPPHQAHHQDHKLTASGSDHQREASTALQESVLKARLRQEFTLGAGLSRDPQNADLPDLALRTTTIYSRWYTQCCPVCKQRFREGDHVRICPECSRVYHDDAQYHLRCWTQHFANGQPCTIERVNPFDNSLIRGCNFRWSGETSTEEGDPVALASTVARISTITHDFLSGLETVWAPYGDAQVDEVKVGDRRIGRECPWCRFQLRVGDRIVKCPCGKCDTYFHDDIFRHLTCWNEWNGSRGNSFCPTTGHPIERTRRREEEGHEPFDDTTRRAI